MYSAIQTGFAGRESMPLCFISRRYPESIFLKISLKCSSDTVPVYNGGYNITDIGNTEVSVLGHYQNLIPYNDFPGHHSYDSTGSIICALKTACIYCDAAAGRLMSQAG